MVNPTGTVTFAQTYDPYGVITATAGTSHTGYGFTGEAQSGDLVYLRARYLNVADGRFLSKDTWGGDDKIPMSHNTWLYAYANSVNLTDPTGHDPYWCNNQSNPDLCFAQWNIDHGGKLTAETLEAIYMKYPDETFRLLQQQFGIKLPAGYSFRLTLSNSSTFDGQYQVRGVEFWFASFNGIQGEIFEFSGVCGVYSSATSSMATHIDYGVYITELAFTIYNFKPDDVAGEMIHEATHAWQESVARDHMNVPRADSENPSSMEWWTKYHPGMERQAVDKALDANRMGRIKLSEKLKNDFDGYKGGYADGDDFPYLLPPNVP